MSEVSLIQAIQSLAAQPIVREFYVFCARYAVFLFIPILAWAWFSHPRSSQRHRVKHACIAFVLSLLLAAVIGDSIGRMRPFLAHPEVLRLVPTPLSEASFPSRHAAVAFAMAIALIDAPLAIVVASLLTACLVAFGRVAVGVHYPTDVLAGAILGTVSALIVQWLHASMRKRDLR